MKQSSTRQNRIISSVTICVLLVLWQVAAMWIGRDLILPSPLETMQEIIRLVQTLAFYQSMLATIVRTVVGFLISFAASIILGSLSYRFTYVEAMLKPVVTVLRSVPTLAVILLALLWIDRDIVPLFIGFLILFPMIYQNVLTGAKETSHKLLEMAKVYHISKINVIRKIYLPSMKPYLKASALAGISLNIKVIIAAEVMSVPKYGIGARMVIEKINYNTVGLFAWALVTVTIALALNMIVEKVK